ncbi:MAG: hypothetical protein KDA79_04135 [Planctomycetaceae bacterium]|nr:hypothetical protein [Planctomycetaceae bacterium]
MRSLPLLMLALAAGTFLLGCSAEERTNEPKGWPVSGTVNLDGKPLASGRIHFIDKDTTPPREAVLDITGGTYSGEVSAGPKRVEIRAFRDDVTASAGGAPTDEDPQYLPKKYNDDSQETAEVKTEGPNEFSFDLTSGD